MIPSAVFVLATALWSWGPPVPFGLGAPTPSELPPSIFEAGDSTAGAASTVKGSLDKEIIRRVIRSHIGEVKDCYERGLAQKPELGGRIMVQFTIAATGQVIASVLQNSTMGEPRVEACTVAAVRRWQFPKPVGGGIVIVSYPFVLTPAAQIPLLAGKNGAGTVDAIMLGDSERFFAHRSTNEQGVPSNGLVAVTERGLLLIDTAWTEAQTDAILRWGDEGLKRPWLGAVITHDHVDRAGGIAALLRRKIPVAALDLTVAKLERRGVRGVTTLFSARDGEIKDARGFEAYYPGPGHAPDNIVVRFPSVVFGGCLIKSTEANELGFIGDANLAAWPAAVGRVSEKYPDKTIVPGHGPVDYSGSAFRHTLDLLKTAAAK